MTNAFIARPSKLNSVFFSPFGLYIFFNMLHCFLVQRPIGLLALLDEESKFPRATDLSLAGMISCLYSFCIIILVTFTEKFHSNFKSSSYYKKPKDGGPTFTILHYAGPVSYEYQALLGIYTVYALMYI